MFLCVCYTRELITYVWTVITCKAQQRHRNITLNVCTDFYNTESTIYRPTPRSILTLRETCCGKEHMEPQEDLRWHFKEVLSVTTQSSWPYVRFGTTIDWQICLSAQLSLHLKGSVQNLRDCRTAPICQPPSPFFPHSWIRPWGTWMPPLGVGSPPQTREEEWVWLTYRS